MEQAQMDEMTKRRFEKLADSIIRNQLKAQDAISELNAAATALEALLASQLDVLEHTDRSSPETERIRGEVQKAWKTFTDDKTMPAIEAVFQVFDTASIEIAQLVGALPEEE